MNYSWEAAGNDFERRRREAQEQRERPAREAEERRVAAQQQIALIKKRIIWPFMKAMGSTGFKWREIGSTHRKAGCWRAVSPNNPNCWLDVFRDGSWEFYRASSGDPLFNNYEGGTVITSSSTTGRGAYLLPDEFVREMQQMLANLMVQHGVAFPS